MSKPLFRMGCDINALDNEMHMGHPNLKASMTIRDAIQASRNNELKRLFARVMGESQVTAAWAAGQTGDHPEARRLAIAALAMRPTSASAWAVLGAALESKP